MCVKPDGYGLKPGEGRTVGKPSARLRRPWLFLFSDGMAQVLKCSAEVKRKKIKLALLQNVS